MQTLLGAAEAAAARRLDRDHVAGSRSTVTFAGSSRAVQEVAARRAVRAAAAARGACAPPLGDQRQPARLEHAQLADDAVAAAPCARRRRSRAAARSARRGADTASSSASTGVESVFDIATWTPDGPSASGHAPWPPPIVS